MFGLPISIWVYEYAGKLFKYLDSLGFFCCCFISLNSIGIHLWCVLSSKWMDTLTKVGFDFSCYAAKWSMCHICTLSRIQYHNNAMWLIKPCSENGSFFSALFHENWEPQPMNIYTSQTSFALVIPTIIAVLGDRGFLLRRYFHFKYVILTDVLLSVHFLFLHSFICLFVLLFFPIFLLHFVTNLKQTHTYKPCEYSGDPILYDWSRKWVRD